MIRVSCGTAMELNILNGKLDIAPTTAYLMIGNKCNNKCAFCSQSIESTSRKDKLSRVLWPELKKEDLINAFLNYKENNIKRICLQVMGSNEALKEAMDFIKYIKSNLDIPISVSAKVENEYDLKELLEIGVDKIGIAIDGANKEVYEKVKGTNFEQKIEFIKNMGSKYKGKISTHIIVGLDETHEDIFILYEDLIKNSVTVSLFAFTPVRGTKLEKHEPPSIESYRRVQLMTYLIKKGYEKDSFKFENGYLTSISPIDTKIYEEIKKGIPFKISGCKDCNRPYYNERPGGTIYNYSRNLNDNECIKVIDELNIKLEVI
ncbi:radical SAM protein [Tepidibacter formicigenes]|jgi:biotin synthase|uniref:Biotin synthase n=1 Tax=Tepidibacter formicigenes DSM 15518 TaxID=1123349 RepID=A0A1M6KU89_9FIRM|nr:radical SAM protein [Tepidibacter formicigenes]SHJ62503.1 biotin synthase [Tepidibacter formicigenes DSM 15518]